MMRIVDVATTPKLSPASTKLCPCGKVCFVSESDAAPFDVAHFFPFCDAVKAAESRAAFVAECTDPLTGRKG
jgi:hypothetical protein